MLLGYNHCREILLQRRLFFPKILDNKKYLLSNGHVQSAEYKIPQRTIKKVNLLHTQLSNYIQNQLTLCTIKCVSDQLTLSPNRWVSNQLTLSPIEFVPNQLMLSPIKCGSNQLTLSAIKCASNQHTCNVYIQRCVMGIQQNLAGYISSQETKNKTQQHKTKKTYVQLATYTLSVV